MVDHDPTKARIKSMSIIADLLISLDLEFEVSLAPCQLDRSSRLSMLTFEICMHKLC